MSRTMALCGLAFLGLALVQFFFLPGAIMGVLCTLVVELEELLIHTFVLMVFGLTYALPVALIAFLIAALMRPEDWGAQIEISAQAYVIAVLLFVSVQACAHLWMEWQLGDIRQEFRQKSGGQMYSCTVDWASIDRRNALLARHGYTIIHGRWEVSGDVWYDESGKPDTCNVDTTATYLYTFLPGSPPKRFGTRR